ncbi:MAG: PIG-L family deacetylase [Cyclobacteriaceae bacterium]|nr:PIG-L family deacetylase [Cyclobacteriaceae bacterium]
MNKLNRRQMLNTTAGVLGASLFSFPSFGRVSDRKQSEKLKIMVVGGHPDDPETGCGGTICKLTAAGHEVISVYLTRGEAGIEGVSHDDAATIRTQEVAEACKITQAQPYFFGQVDGSTIINSDEYKKMALLIEEENPLIVLTHWPIDTHPDHRAAFNLVYNTWNSFRRDEKKAFDLYYFEVLTGDQTQHFSPTHYVDISNTFELKKEATMKHVSQKPIEWYNHHEKMGEFRGLESGLNIKHAEAFARQGVSGIF